MKLREKKLTKWIAHLIGSRTEFSVGARLFHAVSFSTCLLLLLAIPFNIMLGLYSIGGLLLFLLLSHAGIYFLSRVKRKFTLALAGLTFLTYSGVSVNYYFNSGINGPTLFIYFFTFLLLVAVTRRKYHGIYFALTCLVIAALLYFDYHDPGWIKYSFKDRLDRYLDLYFVFILILLFVYIITRSLIDSYYYEKKRANQRTFDLELQQKELERIATEKEKLFSIIFHDLKSPLGSIQMYLEMITNMSVDQEEENRIKVELLRQTKETLAILDNMLIWAKDQVENTKPKLMAVRIDEVAKTCVKIEKPFAEAKNVALIFSMQKEMIVWADGNMLQLLLRILINNAIKFTPEGAPVFVDVYEEDSRCLIKVKDSGRGIPPENQAHIFSLNIHSTMGTNNEKGSGLGLTLAHEFALRQGIDIWFNSKPDEGAEFFLALRIQSPED